MEVDSTTPATEAFPCAVQLHSPVILRTAYLGAPGVPSPVEIVIRAG